MTAVAVFGVGSSSSVFPGLLTKLWLPSVTQLRYNRPNLQRPLPVHWQRKKMLAVCKPKIPDQPKICRKYIEDMPKSQSLEGKPYHQFLARELRKDVETHPMVAIFHTNSFTQHEFIKIQNMLFDLKSDMRVQYNVNNNLAKHAFRRTKFEPMLRLMLSHTSLGFCKTVDIPKLLKAVKKMPQFLLIGLVLEDRLLHRDDVEKLAKLPEMDLLRAQLCATLNLAGQNLVRSLESNQISLASSLSTYSTPTSQGESG